MRDESRARKGLSHRDVTGPRTLEEANGHRADENLVLDDLYKATEVMALTFLDLLEAK